MNGKLMLLDGIDKDMEGRNGGIFTTVFLIILRGLRESLRTLQYCHIPGRESNSEYPQERGKNASHSTETFDNLHIGEVMAADK
jgi:hypothetical protein